MRMFAFLFFFFFGANAAYAVSGISYHGRIMRPNGTPVTSSTTQFLIQIRTPGGENCLLWEEQQTKDLTNLNGMFSATINDTDEPTLIANTLPYTLERVFSNRSPFTSLTGCSSGDSYTPSSALDGRKLQVFFREDPADAWEQMPAVQINFVPLALNSVQLEGYRANEFLKIDPLATYTPLTAANVDTLEELIAGTNSQYLRPSTTFSGDISGAYNSTVVERIRGTPVVATAPTAGQVLKFDGTNWVPDTDGGGSIGDATYSVKGVVQIDTDLVTSGLNITTGVLSLPNLVTAGSVGGASSVPVLSYDAKGRITAVSSATVNDISKLPLAGGTMSGSIDMGTQNITNATSLASTNVSTRNVILADSDTNNLTLRAPTDVTPSNYSLTFPATAGTSGYVLSTDGSGNLSWIAPSTGSITDVTSANTYITINTPSTGVKEVQANVGTASGTLAAGDDSRITGALQTTTYNADIAGITGANVCTGSEKPYWNTVSDTWDCEAISGFVTTSTGFVQDGNSFGAAATLGTNDAFDLNFETNGTTKMTVTSGGNVGINTTSPNFIGVNTSSKALTISGDTGGANYRGVLELRNPTDGGAIGGSIFFVSGSTQSTAAFSRIEGGAEGTGGASGYGSNLRFFTKTDNGTEGERLRITNAGNIGIGTTNPVARLQTSGAAQTTSPTLGSSAGAGLLVTNTDVAYGLLAGVGGGGNAWLQAQRVDASATAYSLLLNPSGGNVGVGTGSPLGPLSVLGSGNAVFWAERNDATDFARPLSVYRRSRSDSVAPGAGFGIQHTVQLEGFTDNSFGTYNLFQTFWENAQTDDTTSRNAAVTFNTMAAGTAAERLRITSGGNVGIGTSTPGAMLEVAGQVKITGGSPGAGKVLTSDAAGLASWVAPSSGESTTASNVGVAGVGVYKQITGANIEFKNVNTASATLTVTDDAANNEVDIGVNIGTTSGTLAAGDDTRIVNAVQQSAYSTDVTDAASCAGNEKPYWSTVSDKWMCTAITGFVTTATGFLQGGNSFAAVANLGTNDAYDLNIETSGASRVTVQADGDVGIGTTAPNKRLEVSHNANAITGMRVSNTDAGTGAAAQIDLINNTTGGSLGITSSTAGGWGAIGASDIFLNSSDDVAITASNVSGVIKFGVGSTPNEVMRIHSTGDVGVGTSSPSSKLHVNGVITADELRDNSPADALYIRTNSTTAGTGSLYIIDSEAKPLFEASPIGTRTNYSWIRIDGGTDTQMPHIGSYSNAGNPGLALGPTTSNSLVITSAGSVGIGNTAPAYTLDVTGDINASGCLRASGSTAAGTCASDERLKTDIQDFNLGLEALLGIQPKTFKYNGLAGIPKSLTPELGVIAQDVEKSAPELIVKRNVKLHPQDSHATEIKQVNYTAFLYMVMNSVKQLYQRIMDQERSHAEQMRSLASIQEDLKVKDEKIRQLENEKVKQAQELIELKLRMEHLEKKILRGESR